MATCNRTPTSFRRTFVLTSMVFGSIASASATKTRPEYEQLVTVIAKVPKTVYLLGEAVPVILIISNHGDKAVYSYREESDFLEAFSFVRDANDKEILLPGDYRDRRPPPPPLSHYIQRDGKAVLCTPVYEIPGHSQMVGLIQDALRVWYKHLSEGVYFLDFDNVLIVHDVNDVMVREDVPHRLWVESKPLMSEVRHKVNTVRIEIRSKPVDQMVPKPGLEPNRPTARSEFSSERLEPVAQVTGRGWLLFLGGVATGVVGLWVVFSLTKRASGK